VKPELMKLAKNIVWLNLSENDLSDRELDFLPQFSNLEKLRLDKNPVTDVIGDYLITLAKLEAVNLNETNITDVATAKLKKNPSMKRVYQWKPGTSEMKLN
jgi:Leucine-rich repeat (LRR) protein